MNPQFVTVLGRRLEYIRIPATKPGLPVLVFLHEGLGSISMWRDFPQRAAERTGCEVIVHSRHGYGRSDVIDVPREVRYMHHESQEALPAFFKAIGVDNPVIVGHSDGASIALLYAGSGNPAKALVLLAPHVFVEDLSIAGIEAARDAYRTTDLPKRLGRHHSDVDKTFWAWNNIWLLPAFRDWNIADCLPTVRCPVTVIQGYDDEYGTMAQLDAIERQVGGPCELVRLENCAHSPHRDQSDAVLAVIERVVASVV